MKSIGRGFAYFTSASAIGTLTQVAKGKLGAIFLGAAGVGVLNQLTTFWTLAQIAAGLGFNAGIVRAVSSSIRDQDDERLQRHVTSVVLFLSTLALSVTLICIAASGAISHALFGDGGIRSDLVILIVLSVPLSVLANVYKSVLSGAQAAGDIVKTQIVADVSSVVLFLAFVVAFDIRGAALAFTAFQAVLFGTRFIAALRISAFSTTSSLFRTFDWRAIRENVLYGVNALVTTGIHALTLLVVSRMIIERFGLADNGIFSVAMKVGTLFLAGVYGSSASLYFPSLVAAPRDEVSVLLSRMLFFYSSVLPPLIVTLMLGGRLLITVLFSREFAYAGVLMAFLLLADMLKMVTEIIGLTLVAKDRITYVTASYFAYALLLLAGASGVAGTGTLLAIALVFVVSQALHLALVWTLARHTLQLQVTRPAVASFVRGFLLMMTAAGCVALVERWEFRVPVVILAMLMWFGASWTDDDFRSLVRRAVVFARLRK